MAIFEELAVRYITDMMQEDWGLTDFQAAGIVGNGGHESGGFTQLQELNPTIPGSAGGLGHFQWTGPRRRAFETWIARNAHKGWTAATYEANYSMLFRELVGPERAALEAVKQTTTLEEATRVFCEKFERPGIVHMESRLSWAQKALTAFKASGIDPRAGLAAAPVDLQQIVAALLPLLLQALTGRPVALPAQPVPPPPVPAPAPAASGAATDLRTGIVGVLASLAASFFGVIGDPAGPASTATGTLLPLAIGMASGLGVPSTIMKIAGAVLPALLNRLVKK